MKSIGGIKLFIGNYDCHEGDFVGCSRHCLYGNLFYLQREEMVMACFLVTVAEAVVTTIVTQVVKSKETQTPKETSENNALQSAAENKIPFSRKLGWLNKLLWGGSFLLAFEHVWHGEVVPWFPFLTAAENAADAAEMLHEMATAGVAMAVLVTLVWDGMVLVSNVLEKKSIKAKAIKTN